MLSSEFESEVVADKALVDDARLDSPLVDSLLDIDVDCPLADSLPVFPVESWPVNSLPGVAVEPSSVDWLPDAAVEFAGIPVRVPFAPSFVEDAGALALFTDWSVPTLLSLALIMPLCKHTLVYGGFGTGLGCKYKVGILGVSKDTLQCCDNHYR